MKMAENSGRLRIVGDGAIVHDSCPPGYYKLWFDDREGHWLTRLPQMQEVLPMYGPMAGKETKIIEAYKRRSGNTGVVLEGPMGLGKSLMARRVAQLGVAEGLPVIVVGHIKNIAEYIESFTQPAVWLLDEFEKNYRSDNSIGSDEQAQFLPVLDGMTSNKRLFIITCNGVAGLSKYLLNRPGRIYYKITFGFPDTATVSKYLRSQGIPEGHPCFEELAAMAGFARFNFDSLHAIAQEIINGSTLCEALTDLNIESKGAGTQLEVELRFRGRVWTLSSGSPYINESGVSMCNVWMRCKEGDSLYISDMHVGSFEFIGRDCVLCRDIEWRGFIRKNDKAAQVLDDDPPFDDDDPGSVDLPPPERLVLTIKEPPMRGSIYGLFKWNKEAKNPE